MPERSGIDIGGRCVLKGGGVVGALPREARGIKGGATRTSCCADLSTSSICTVAAGMPLEQESRKPDVRGVRGALGAGAKAWDWE